MINLICECLQISDHIGRLLQPVLSSLLCPLSRQCPQACPKSLQQEAKAKRHLCDMLYRHLVQRLSGMDQSVICLAV